MYSSEQQDWSDDEVNIITKAGNYGWPLASGYYDGSYDGLTLAGLPVVVSEKQDSINFQLRATIFTLYTEPDPARLMGKSNSIWPTVACSSLDVYEKPVIPGWNRSLLIPSLKAGLIQRLKLDASGMNVIDFSSQNANYKGKILEYTYIGSVMAIEDLDKITSPIKNIEISLYPNPAQKVLNVRIHSGMNKLLHYTINEQHGKMILSGKL